MLGIKAVTLWQGLKCLNMGSMAGSCGSENEPSDFVKFGKVYAT
jgi:hypothetical protein